MSSTSTTPSPRPDSALAPLRRRAFFWLWVAVVVSSIGAWGQTVGAQWLFINDPNAATIVPLVQAASTLPVMILALPAGVLADVFDRRWLMFGVQVYFVVVSVLLTILTALGHMPASLLLAFTFAIGAGVAMLQPAWQALISELVPRRELVAANQLNMVSVNLSRAAGPALAGVMIALWDVPSVFAFNAVAGLFLAVVLLAWRRGRVSHGEREPFLPALRAGGRYVKNEPVMRRILVRLATFMAPACAVWALLPLIASQNLGLGADGYGVLFGSLGVGAVVASFGLKFMKRFLSSNGVLTFASLLYAATLATLAVVPTIWLAAPTLVVCGFAWAAAATAIISELQLFLPGWVRARALSVYIMVFLGTQSIASPLWGLATQHLGLTEAVLLAAALVVIGTLGTYFLRVPDAEGIDVSATEHWGEPDLAFDPPPTSGPVVVSISYEVPEENEEPFLVAVGRLRVSRTRSGATRWELYRVGEAPNLYLEQFEIRTWQEHLLQHEGRLTAEDKELEDAVFDLVYGTPRTQHLFPPDVAHGLPARWHPAMILNRLDRIKQNVTHARNNRW